MLRKAGKREWRNEKRSELRKSLKQRGNHATLMSLVEILDDGREGENRKRERQKKSVYRADMRAKKSGLTRLQKG